MNFTYIIRHERFFFFDKLVTGGMCLPCNDILIDVLVLFQVGFQDSILFLVLRNRYGLHKVDIRRLLLLAQ